MTLDKPDEHILREFAVRQALEDAAKRIENYGANHTYRQALKLAARLIREMKPG